MLSGGACSGSPRRTSASSRTVVVARRRRRRPILDLTSLGIAAPVRSRTCSTTGPHLRDELDAVHLSISSAGPPSTGVPAAGRVAVRSLDDAGNPVAPRATLRLLFGERPSEPTPPSPGTFTRRRPSRDPSSVGRHLRLQPRVHRAREYGQRSTTSVPCATRALARLPPPGTPRGAGTQLRHLPRRDSLASRMHMSARSTPRRSVGARRVRRRAPAGRRGGAPAAAPLVEERLAELL